MENLLKTLSKMDCKGPRLDKLPKEVLAGITAHCALRDADRLSKYEQLISDDCNADRVLRSLTNVPNTA